MFYGSNRNLTLSQREEEILLLASRGLTDRQISTELGYPRRHDQYALVSHSPQTRRRHTVGSRLNSPQGESSRDSASA